MQRCKFSFPVLIVVVSWMFGVNMGSTWLNSCSSFLCEHCLTLRKHLSGLAFSVSEMLIKRAGLVTCSVWKSHPFFLVLQQFFCTVREFSLSHFQHPDLVLLRLFVTEIVCVKRDCGYRVTSVLRDTELF